MAGVYGGYWLTKLEFARVAFNTALAQLHAQRDYTASLRSQANFSMGMTGLLGTVFASLFVASGKVASDFEAVAFGIPLEFLLVFGPFLGTIVFSLRAFTGWGKAVFDLNPAWLIELSEYTEVSTAYTKAAEEADKHFDDNEILIKDIRRNLWWANCLVLFQAPAWLNLIF